MKRFLSILMAATLLLGLLPAASFAEGQKYGESPLLAAEVAAGTLPAVEDRLPVEPYVSKAEKAPPVPFLLHNAIRRYLQRLRDEPRGQRTDQHFILKDFQQAMQQEPSLDVTDSYCTLVSVLCARPFKKFAFSS